MTMKGKEGQKRTKKGKEDNQRRKREVCQEFTSICIWSLSRYAQVLYRFITFPPS
jgi:hypothetical protein